MTPKQTLKGRLELLKELDCLVDGDILIVIHNRKLDINLVQLKHFNTHRFTDYLNEIQTLYSRYNKQIQ